MPKNKDGYFRKTFAIGKDADGKPRRVTIRGKTKKEMEEKYNEAKRMHGLGLSMGEATVYDWADRWFRVYKANASDGQKVRYRINLNKDILPIIGHLKIRDIRPSQLQELLNKYEGGKLNTVKKIRITLRQLFDDAELEGIIERNPARRLELPRLISKARRPLTGLEREILFEVAKTHKYGTYVLTMLFCGLRRGECIALKVKDIDFDNMRVNVNKSIRFQGNIGIEKDTKTKAGNRVVPLPDVLMPFLVKQCANKIHEDAVFLKVNGEAATQTTVSWWWKSFIGQCHRASGVETYRNKLKLETSSFSNEITPHYLRHTYATDLYAAGVDDRATKVFLGHSSNDVTDIYRQMNETAFIRAAALFNDYTKKIHCSSNK